MHLSRNYGIFFTFLLLTQHQSQEGVIKSPHCFIWTANSCKFIPDVYLLLLFSRILIVSPSAHQHSIKRTILKMTGYFAFHSWKTSKDSAAFADEKVKSCAKPLGLIYSNSLEEPVARQICKMLITYILSV